MIEAWRWDVRREKLRSGVDLLGVGAKNLGVAWICWWLARKTMEWRGFAGGWREKLLSGVDLLGVGVKNIVVGRIC